MIPFRRASSRLAVVALLLTGLAGAAALGATPAAAAAAPAAGGWVGRTGLIFSPEASSALLTHSITITPQEPAAGSQMAPDKLLYALPVSKVVFDGDRVAENVAKVNHYGSLVLSHGDGYTLRTIILDNIRANFRKGRIIADVYAGEASKGSGSLEELGRMTIFDIRMKKDPSSLGKSYALFVGKKLAPAVERHLGWFPAAGSRVGSGDTTVEPLPR